GRDRRNDLCVGNVDRRGRDLDTVHLYQSVFPAQVLALHDEQETGENGLIEDRVGGRGLRLELVDDGRLEGNNVKVAPAHGKRRLDRATALDQHNRRLIQSARAVGGRKGGPRVEKLFRRHRLRPNFHQLDLLGQLRREQRLQLRRQPAKVRARCWRLQGG